MGRASATAKCSLQGHGSFDQYRFVTSYLGKAGDLDSRCSKLDSRYRCGTVAIITSEVCGVDPLEHNTVSLSAYSDLVSGEEFISEIRIGERILSVSSIIYGNERFDRRRGLLRKNPRGYSAFARLVCSETGQSMCAVWSRSAWKPGF